MARDPAKEFSYQTKRRALDRQDYLCASCASLILPFDGRLVSVAWEESAHAHHRKPMHSGGGGNVENCVILCSSCHYSAHEGGRYRPYDEKKKNDALFGRIRDFPYYRGSKGHEHE